MTTTESTPPAFDGSHGSMADMGFQPFSDWWSTLPAGAQVLLVLGFLAAMGAMIWWGVHHERRHTPAPMPRNRPKKHGHGRSSSPGT